MLPITSARSAFSTVGASVMSSRFGASPGVMARGTARVIGTVAATALLTACGSAAAPADEPLGRVAIVASTNVYGDIAQQIGGAHVSVTSLITSPSQDPHEYEASARDRVTIAHADLVVENGGGYDPFVDTLVAAAGTDPVVVNAVAVSGLVPRTAAGSVPDAHPEHAHEHVEGVNEHVWYELGAMDKLGAELATALGRLDPAHAAAYDANYAGFAQELAALTEQADALAARIGGQGAAITEPVPLYVLDAVGLVNKTPGEFSEAVEEGSDVPPRALQETLSLFTDHAVALLAYNDQASDPTTERVRAAAIAAGIPVVDFSETLPDGMGYVAWQRTNIDNIAAALA